MKKVLTVLAALFLVITITGCTKQLTREDFNQLPDKNFYVADVVVGHLSQKGLIVSGVGVKEESIKKEALLALPVEEMSRIVADELKIQVDTSEYKTADLKAINSKMSIFTKYDYLHDILLWRSTKAEKKDINKVNFKFLLWEKQTSGIGFAVFFGMACEIEIISAAGHKKYFTVWLPDQSKHDSEIMSKENGKILYNIEKMAKAQNQPVMEMTKIMMLEELVKLPALMKTEISKAK